MQTIIENIGSSVNNSNSGKRFGGMLKQAIATVEGAAMDMSKMIANGASQPSHFSPDLDALNYALPLGGFRTDLPSQRSISVETDELIYEAQFRAPVMQFTHNHIDSLKREKELIMSIRILQEEKALLLRDLTEQKGQWEAKYGALQKTIFEFEDENGSLKRDVQMIREIEIALEEEKQGLIVENEEIKIEIKKLLREVDQLKIECNELIKERDSKTAYKTVAFISIAVETEEQKPQIINKSASSIETEYWNHQREALLQRIHDLTIGKEMNQCEELRMERERREELEAEMNDLRSLYLTQIDQLRHQICPSH